MFKYFLTYFTLILFLGVFFRNFIKVIEGYNYTYRLEGLRERNKPLVEVLIFMGIFLTIFSLVFVPYQLDTYLFFVVNSIVFLSFNLYLCKLSYNDVKFMNMSFSFIGSVYTFIILKSFIFFIIAFSS